MVKGYGFCTSGFLNDELQKECDAGTMELTELDLSLMDTPSVPYVFIQAKTDIVQQSFYISIAISINATKKTITPTEFYNGVNDIFGLYSAQRSNFVTYLIDGDHHCYTPQIQYYTADPISMDDNGANTQNMNLYEYVNTLPLSKNMQISTVCDGTIKGVRGEADDNTYCSSRVVPKTYVEPN
ncbi:hypothetical protein EON63_13410 [archaeon]|nr:MAG: hypothetical protein EON63_13410 [archaeon]